MAHRLWHLPLVLCLAAGCEPDAAADPDAAAPAPDAAVPTPDATALDATAPDAAPDAAPPPAPRAAPRAATPGARVLVAEDNPVNRQITRWMLERAGYRCAVVDDGQQALDAEAEGGFDVILMDCQMPNVDGLEATRRLRARGCRRPIIALTAGALAEERAACVEAGMDAFLAKPVEAARLVETIEVWLGARDAR
ncbi:MAG: response regulator [bacterium]